MARGVRFLLGFRQYPFLKKTGPGIPVFGYCPILKLQRQCRGAQSARKLLPLCHTTAVVRAPKSPSPGGAF